MGEFHLPIEDKFFKLPKVGSILDFGYDRGLRAGTTVRHHHQGIDLVAPKGVKLYAITDGIVTHAWDGDGPARGFGGYGRMIIVHSAGVVFSLKSQPKEVDLDLHEDGPGDDLYMMHSHCSRVLAKVGDRVVKGQHIADVGGTAFSKANPTKMCGTHDHHELALLPYPKGLDRKKADYGRIHPSKFYEDNR
jgi:murein DD-endopeptidase MepM/ murein hydrolase activator NlpD